MSEKDAKGSEYNAADHKFMNRGDVQPAARCAFWLGFTSLLNGEVAKASGWLSRASRLLEGQPDCVEKGYMLLPAGYRSVQAGDDIGNRFRDKDLVTLGLQGQGRALIRQGEIARGMALLDEAMVAVTAGEVSALNAGGVYCSVLDACGEVFDLQRAQEWTSALESSIPCLDPLSPNDRRNHEKPASRRSDHISPKRTSGRP